MYVVCVNSKYGYCQYGNHCDKIHFTKENVECMKPIEKVLSEKVVVHCENESMSLEEIIRENSWFMCEKCDYKAKSKKRLTLHIVKMHSVVSREESKSAYYILNSSNNIYRRCNICG